MAFNKIAGAFVDQSLDNYLPSIKSNTSINDNLWYTYNNNSATPINGTGASNLIVSTTETNGLRISKNNSSFFGHGISSSFAVAKRHLAKVLQIVFDVEFISGNYSKGDIKVYIIANPDTSPILIEPINVEISTGVAGFSIRHIASFQTHITITSYRICLHIANTNTSAYTLEFSNFKVWEPIQSVGAVITDWQSYTPTINGITSSSSSFQWRRVGGSVEITGSFTFSSVISAIFQLPLPSGLSISSIITRKTLFGKLHLGKATPDGSNPQWFLIGNGNTSYLTLSLQSSNYNSTFTDFNSNSTGAGSGDIFTLFATVPIAGWGSSVAMSSDTGDGRVVAGSYSNHTGKSFSGLPPFEFNTRNLDTHNCYSAGTITIPINGNYEFKMSGIEPSVSSTSVQIHRNGIGILGFGSIIPSYTCSLSILVSNLVAGDVIQIRPTNGGFSSTSSIVASLSWFRISAGSQIIATQETVACSYWLTSNTASNTNPIPFGGPTGTVGRIYDTHGSMINGTFTAPVNGIYLVTGHIGTGTTGNWIEVWIDGSQNRRRFLIDTSSYTKNVYIQLRLLAGQTLQLRPYTAFTVGGGTLDSGGTSQIEISRITL